MAQSGTLRLERVGSDEWTFVWPRAAGAAEDLFYEALEEMESGSARKAKTLLQKALGIFPDHIDVLHHLSLLAGSEEEERALNARAVAAGWQAFPKAFNTEQHRLEWGWLENRPFLRACHAQAMRLLDDGKTDDALVQFRRMLVWNPNDNQGIRSILADQYVHGGKWDQMIALAKKYPGNIDPSMGYGLALALRKNGQIPAAKRQLKKMLKDLPRCARILLEKNPRKPKSEVPGYITFGGQDQAYEFWESQGRASAWRAAETQQWVQQTIAECQGKGKRPE